MICPHCSHKNYSQVFFCGSCGKPIKHFDLLKGMKIEGNMQKGLHALYKKRYDNQNSPFAEVARQDTLEYVFQRHYRSQYQIPTAAKDANTVTSLSRGDIEQLEDLYQEVLIIGYLQRVNLDWSMDSQSRTYLRSTWARGNLKPEDVIDGIASHGGIPFGPHMTLYDHANPIIIRNLRATSPYMNSQDQELLLETVIQLENIGYFLCERDLSFTVPLR